MEVVPHGGWQCSNAGVLVSLSCALVMSVW